MHLLDLADETKDGVTEAGMVGCRFNMIGVSDRTSMGTRGECDARRNAICRAELHRTAYRSSFAVCIARPVCGQTATYAAWTLATLPWWGTDEEVCELSAAQAPPPVGRRSLTFAAM